ncbi:uncharacterized protein LOC133496008 [Syngnathoides biaculeatus]|uniref:uncharacterized protein LOC133496008 n=1 Tax=Syngnathoides biaculeatus TaxID=300417 RepID=UPI002ADDA007|nr:uncharacterized protein LOC133496008 [Syngnathoides biaculeatus]
MSGQWLFQYVLILWLVQSVRTGGYGAGVSGLPTGHEAHFNGKRGHNGGGAGRMPIPSKGAGSSLGVQNSYGGYPNKGVGYGGAAGMANGAGTKGYGAAQAQGSWPQGYGGHAGPANQHPMKGYGYRAHAGILGGPRNQGYGGPPAGPQSGNKGYGPASGALGGMESKTNGYGAKFGVPNGAGNNGLLGSGRKPMKGYGQPYYGAGMGVSQSRVVPQLPRNQDKGYAGGYGSAGMGLGPRYGSGGLKGPKPGYGGAAGVPNRRDAVPNGHGYLNGGTHYPIKPAYGNGVKPSGYGTRGRGYGIGVVPVGYGARRNGYGAGGTKGYGAKPNGPGNGPPC